MKWLKYITMTFALGYTIIGLYYDTFANSEYINQKLIDIIKFGDGLIITDYREYRLGKNVSTIYSKKDGTLRCLKNMKLKYIDVEDASYKAVYRGSEANNTIMCEMSTYPDAEGPTAGEPKASIIWFDASDVDNIPIGKAIEYVRGKQKEKSTKNDK